MASGAAHGHPGPVGCTAPGGSVPASANANWPALKEMAPLRFRRKSPFGITTARRQGHHIAALGALRRWTRRPAGSIKLAWAAADETERWCAGEVGTTSK